MTNLLYISLLTTFLYSNNFNSNDSNKINLNKRFISKDIRKMYTRNMAQLDRNSTYYYISKYNIKDTFDNIEIYRFYLDNSTYNLHLNQNNLEDFRLLFLFHNEDSTFYKIDLNMDQNLMDEKYYLISKAGYTNDHILYFSFDSTNCNIDSTLLGIKFDLEENVIGYCFKEELYGSFFINSTLYCIELNNEKSVSLIYENPLILIQKCNSDYISDEIIKPKLTFSIKDNIMFIKNE